MLTSLKIRGPFRGPSGYEHHTREFAKELNRQGIAVELTDLPQWSPAKLPNNLQDPFFETLLTPTDADMMLHFCFPDQLARDKDRINVNFTMFEATGIPRSWVEAGKQHDRIILPTQSSRRAWIDSGADPENIRLCPLGVGPDYFRDDVPALAIVDQDGRRISDYGVRFLNVSEIGPRKNLAGLLRAWLQATTRTDDAVLILKLGCYSPGSLTSFWFELGLAQQKVGKALAEAAPVKLIFDVLPDADMPRLFATATHYISMSFGEGWDMPMTEAGASGLKLIAPRHSAYTSYLDDAIASFIPCREVTAGVWNNDIPDKLFGGVNWWEPNEAEAVRLIQRAIRGEDSDKVSARPRIAANCTWEKATRQLLAILNELER